MHIVRRRSEHVPKDKKIVLDYPKNKKKQCTSAANIGARFKRQKVDELDSKSGAASGSCAFVRDQMLHQEDLVLCIGTTTKYY